MPQSNLVENLDPMTFRSMMTLDDVQCTAYRGSSSSGNDQRQRSALYREMTAKECFALANDDFKPFQRQLQLPIRDGSFSEGPVVNSSFDDWCDLFPLKHQKYQQLLFDGRTSGFQNLDVVEKGNKRATVEDHLEENVAIRRQKRMIKNRESAARSRERKQKYITDLESLVRRLTEENARLKSEQETTRKSLDEVSRKAKGKTRFRGFVFKEFFHAQWAGAAATWTPSFLT